jgi:hypothetical protein
MPYLIAGVIGFFGIGSKKRKAKLALQSKRVKFDQKLVFLFLQGNESSNPKVFISIFSLLFCHVLVSEFLFLSKSDQETSFCKIFRIGLAAVDREFDFVSDLMDVRNEDTLSFFKISFNTGIHFSF